MRFNVFGVEVRAAVRLGLQLPWLVHARLQRDTRDLNFQVASITDGVLSGRHRDLVLYFPRVANHATFLVRARVDREVLVLEDTVVVEFLEVPEKSTPVTGSLEVTRGAATFAHPSSGAGDKTDLAKER
jgi:hypothetical protein